MRFGLLFLPIFAVACVASSAPEANGYNVELYFAGAPLGEQTPVGAPAIVTVQRIEQRPDLCAQGSASCNPTSDTPIALVSASCDAICAVTAVPGDDGTVTLRVSASAPGSTTLRVRVRSEIDGSEWDDGYPLAFRDASARDVNAALAPSLSEIDKSPAKK